MSVYCELCSIVHATEFLYFGGDGLINGLNNDSTLFLLILGGVIEHKVNTYKN